MKKFKFDVRTLFLINILFSIFIFFVQNRMLNHFCIITALVLAILSGIYKQMLKFILVYTVSFILQNYSEYINNQSLRIVVNLSFYIVMNLLPLLIISSIIINTIKTNEFINVLEKMKLPREFIIALTVAFRYIPTIKEESKKISDNMKLREINCSLLSPLKSFEYIMVPLLFRSMKIAEELAISAAIRGVEHKEKRTSFYNVSMNKMDYTVIILTLLLSILLVITSS